MYIHRIFLQEKISKENQKKKSVLADEKLV
jgi:hypothetical protein